MSAPIICNLPAALFTALEIRWAGVERLTISGGEFIGSTTQPRAVAYHSALQSINNATETILNLNSEDVDTQTMHDLVTNNSRITVPVNGFYLVSVKALFALNATGLRYLYLAKNGTVFRYLDERPGSSACDQILNATIQVQLTGLDYLELGAFQSSGGALNVGHATRHSSTELSVVKLW